MRNFTQSSHCSRELKWNRIELKSRDFLPSSGARSLAVVETKNEKKNVKRGTSRTQHLMDFCVKSVYARLESSARAMLTVYAFSSFFLQYISKTYNCDSRRALRYGKLLTISFERARCGASRCASLTCAHAVRPLIQWTAKCEEECAVWNRNKEKYTHSTRALK